MRATVFAPLFFLAWASLAQAESLITAFSSDHIAIDSNFTGADLTLFGSIEDHPSTLGRARPYDLVIIAKGPAGPVKVRKKEAFGPFWLNREQAVLPSVPSFLAILTDRPIQDIIDPPTQERFATSLAQQLVRYDANVEPSFREALLHLRRDEHLFTDDTGTVEFLSPTVFRATIHLPGSAPLGLYEVQVLAFAGGKDVALQEISFQVNRSGIEHQLAVAAKSHGIFYGLAIVAMALSFGWIASVIFRRD